MGVIYGLHCTNPRCVHETVKCYRLRFLMRPDGTCTRCGRHGIPMSEADAAIGLGLIKRPDEFDQLHDVDKEATTKWWRCGLPNPCGEPWRRIIVKERNDLVFRDNQIESALAQMRMLGVENPGIGYHVVQNHRSVPRYADMRVLILKRELLPRMALYLDWNPQGGEKLVPGMVLQALFTPGMTAAERRTAQIRRMLPDEFEELVRYTVPAVQKLDDGRHVNAAKIETVSRIKCQHCMTALPLRAFSTAALHETAWGE